MLSRRAVRSCRAVVATRGVARRPRPDPRLPWRSSSCAPGSPRCWSSARSDGAVRRAPAPVGQRDQPVGEPERAHLARRRARGRAAADGRERPNVLIVNYSDSTTPPARTPPTAGRRPRRTCSAPGCRATRRALVTYLGTIDNFLAGSPDDTERARATTTREVHCCEAFGGARPTVPDTRSRPTSAAVPPVPGAAPVVFLIGQYYGRACATGSSTARTEMRISCSRRPREGHQRPDVWPRNVSGGSENERLVCAAGRRGGAGAGGGRGETGRARQPPRRVRQPRAQPPRAARSCAVLIVPGLARVAVVRPASPRSIGSP